MSILKMIKLQNLVQSVMTYKKYNLAKFATFVYFGVKHVKIDTTIEIQESPSMCNAINMHNWQFFYFFLFCGNLSQKINKNIKMFTKTT